MSDTLDAIRQKFPSYADRSDEELTLAIGEKHPVYLKADPAFDKEYSIAFAKRAQSAPQEKSILDRLSRFAPPNELEGVFDESTGKMTSSPVEGMTAAGKLLAASAADTLGSAGNVEAAGLDPLGKPLPAEQQLAEMGTPGAAATRGALGVVRSLPALAVASVAAPVVSPYVAFPAVFGAETYSQTGGDLAATAKSAGVAALFPLVGKLLTPVGAKVGSELVTSGLIKAGNTTAQKAVEAAIHQAGFQATAQLADLPEYMDMTPKERFNHWVESTTALSLFAIPQLLNIPRGSIPSDTQGKLRSMVEEAARKHYEEAGRPVEAKPGEAPPKATAAETETPPASAPQLVVGREPGPGEYRVTDESVIADAMSRQAPPADPSLPIGVRGDLTEVQPMAVKAGPIADPPAPPELHKSSQPAAELKGEASSFNKASETAPPSADIPPRERPLTIQGRFDRETELGGPDVLSFIQQNGGMMSKSEARRTRGEDWWKLNSPLYDDFAPLSSPHHNLIYQGKRPQDPDQIAQEAFDAGIIRAPDVNELWRAIDAASTARSNLKRQQEILDKHLAESAAWQDAISKGGEKINANELKVGEHFEVNGEKVRVKDIDPDTGEVTLEDGAKFGRQIVREGESLYVENYHERIDPESRPNDQSEVFSPPSLEKGGELGDQKPPPFRPADNPNFSVFDAMPMELPEAVRLSRDLLHGIYPKVRERLQGLSGKAAGVFSHTTGPGGRAHIEIKASAADLLTAKEKAELRREAEQYARATTDDPKEFKHVADAKYEDLLAKAYEDAKTRNPVWALKVMWHEIGHLVDWLPDKYITGRGNLLGHIAALKHFSEHVLPIDPTRPAGERPNEKELRGLHAEAEKQLRDEMGPIRETVEKIIVEEPILKIVGITPEDVKSLLGMDAREKMPELYLWFAQQDGKVKAEILKKAMRGLLDERLKRMGRTERDGVRRTEKTVRSKVGRDPTREEIADRFKVLFREELERRNLAELKIIKAELEPMIAWWRGTEKMEPYFASGHEMYAEAFSVLMNNPAAVLERAPNYYRLMFNHMNSRPDFSSRYQQMQDMIKSGQIMTDRVQNLRSSWWADDERAISKFGRNLKVSGKEWLDNVLYHFDRRMGPIYRAAGGDNGPVRDAIGNYLYRASEHELILNSINRDVGASLVRQNLDWSDLGEYMFHQRIINDRFNIFNPQGWTSKNSLERLAEMKQTLGPERFAALEDGQARFRDIYEREVLSRVREAGLFSEETQKLIDDRVWYATFSAVKGEPTKGIDQLIAASVGSDIGPRIYRQIGNLGEIKNPATATVLKALSLVSAADRNIARRETVRMLLQNDPNNIRRADRRFDGRRMVDIIRENEKMGTVVFMNEGKPEAYYVRKPVAEALNFSNPIENRLYSSLISSTNWLKGMFTQLNYAFWPVNMVRDTGTFWLNMPGIDAPVGWAKNFPKALRAARDSVKGIKANPIADAALRRRMLVSRADPKGVWASTDNEFDLKVASFGLDPAQWNKQVGKVGVLAKAWQHYRNFGQIAERVNKIGGMLYLDEKFPTMPEWKKRQIVRERAGSPNFLERGASNSAIDLFAMFYNPWKEGIRSMGKAARENPWSFGAKVSGLILAPSMLQAAATAGLLGDDLKKKYRSVPDYDLSNYLIVPLGWQNEKEGKVAYLRLPLPEPARIAHGLLYKGLTGRGRDSMEYMGGQLPAVNAGLGVAAAWAQYELSGHNPYDSFRGKGVLSDAAFKAGGAEARKELAKWSWNNLGGPLLYRFQNTQLESPPEGAVEEFLQLPVVNNALGRWVKVSNRGLDDEARQVTAPIEKKRAEIQLAMKDVIEKVASGQALTDSEKILMREPYAIQYFLRTFPEVMKARSSPLIRRMENAGSAEGKAAVLKNAVDRGDLQPAP